MNAESDELDEIWKRYAQKLGIYEKRPSYRFDPIFYAETYLGGSPEIDANDHYSQYGQKDDLAPNSFGWLNKNTANLAKRLQRFVIDPELSALLNAGVGHELAFEIISLGNPIDLQVSNFSECHYTGLYKDIRDANISPFRHFMQYGWGERRRTLRDVRRNVHKGEQLFDPSKPTCLICGHELSRTGAPIVGLNLVEEASKTHNVIFVGLAGGPLLERYRRNCVSVAVGVSAAELHYVLDEYLDVIEFSILNSVVSCSFIPFLLKAQLPFSMYIHEYSHYIFPRDMMKMSIAFSDLLVFSSNQLRQSWDWLLDEMEFDKDKRTLIQPQDRFESNLISKAAYSKSRALVSDLIGVDCSNKRIVYGAGQAQLRKGTDLFVLTSQISRKSSPDTIFIWIGDGFNHEDWSFGMWIDQHVAEAESSAQDKNLYFLPAGDYYRDVVRASDILYMSSRLDPLPNVVFDAGKFGCQILLFENASGFDDPLYKDTGVFHTVGFGDVAAASATLQKMPLKSFATRTENEARDRNVPELELFELFRKRLCEVDGTSGTLAQKTDGFSITGLQEIDQLPAEYRLAALAKLQSREVRLAWRDLDHVTSTLKQSDSWIHKTLHVDRSAILPTEDLPEFNIHLHAENIVELSEECQAFAGFRRAKKIRVTTDNQRKQMEISSILADLGLTAEVRVVEGRGQNILPFFNTIVAEDAGDPSDIWLHLHRLETSFNQVDREVLLSNLLGDASSMTTALAMFTDPDISFVGAMDSRMVMWGDSVRWLPTVEEQFENSIREAPLLAPLGNMFWLRRHVALAMKDLFGKNHAWSGPPLPSAGSEYQMIQSLWTAVTAKEGSKSFFLASSGDLKGVK